MPRQLREEPGVPCFALGRVPVGPGDAGAQLRNAQRLQVGQHTIDALVLARAETIPACQ